VKLLQKNLEEAAMERDSFIRKVNSLKLFYEGILNHSPAEIFVINPELVLTYVNRLFVENESGIHRQLGKGLHEISGSDEFDSERWLNIIEKIKQSLEAGALVQFEEVRKLEGSGGRNILRNILPNYNDKGVLEHIVVSGVDITDLKQIQADVVSKNEELRKINAELDNFVYSISHDLRSPLLSIKGILDLIIEKGGLDENNLRYIEMADLSAGRLDGTIQEILEYSRNARLELKLSEFNLKEMVEAIFDDLRYSDPYEMKFELELEGSPIFYTDKYRLNTLLKNIIGNSVKYKRTNIADSFVLVKIFRNTNSFVIQIVDNGEGISTKNVSKIFDMFYRGTSKSVGTGLGLYICKEILNKLKGHVTVDSVQGEGTTMTIVLPLLNSND
jgi:signal transduction histidine kinase